MKKILYILTILLFTSCAVTYDVNPRCELMQRGEPCLTNHACCKPPQTYYHQTYPNWHWWYWNKPTTNYVIVKPNKPNKPNNSKPNKPNRKPRHRK